MVAGTAAPRMGTPPPAAAPTEEASKRRFPTVPGLTDERMEQLRTMVRERSATAAAHLWAQLRTAAIRAYTTVNDIWELARREGIPRLLMVMLLVAITIAALVYYVELKNFVPAQDGDTPLINSLGTAFWWAVVTMTTTGYGDVYPKSNAGRLIASLLMISGSLILSLFTASFASLLVAQRLREDQGLSVLKVKFHIIIIGWNRHVERVISGLAAVSGRRPNIVLINQLPEAQLSELKFKYRNFNVETVSGDPTHQAVLDRANLAESSAVILMADEAQGDPAKADDRTLFTALAVRDMNSEVKLCAQLMDPDKEAAIRNAGVDEIVITGQDTSFFLTSGAVYPGMVRVAQQLLTYGSGREIKRSELPRELRGQTFREARLYYRTTGQLLIGIISEAAVVTIGDLLGSSTDWVDEFIRSAFQSSGSDVVDQDKDRTQAILAPPDDYVIGGKDFGIIIGAPAAPERAERAERAAASAR